jgi:biopolymer transport protein ExbD
MFYAGKKKKGPEIMMAPLIDCVFLLLIFFMTTTVFPENAGIEVDKPKAVTGRALPKDHVLFALSREGGFFHEGRQRSLDEVTEIIKAEVTVRPASAVILQPDKRSMTDNLVRFLDTARKAGARNISIATEPDKEK